MGIVDREKEQELILAIEGLFDKYGLMADEKRFILSACIGRINTSGQKQKLSDLMQQGMSKGLIKNMMDKIMKGDKDE